MSNDFLINLTESLDKLKYQLYHVNDCMEDVDIMDNTAKLLLTMGAANERTKIALQTVYEIIKFTNNEFPKPGENNDQ